MVINWSCKPVKRKKLLKFSWKRGKIMVKWKKNNKMVLRHGTKEAIASFRVSLGVQDNDLVLWRDFPTP